MPAAAETRRFQRKLQEVDVAAFMTTPTAMQADNDPIPAAEIPAATEAEVETTTDAPAALDPWEELEAEAAKWKEISLRTAAEMENLRKRTAREREDAIRYANQRLLEELLPVIDNFEMGMHAAAQDTKSMIYIGMDMVRRQLNEFLTSQGVEEIPTNGNFDPNLHDAVAQEECAAGEEGRVLKVTRRGFKLRDRLLRPASVVVSTLPTPAQ
jgi:molecular chaperone GrpE